MNQATPGLFAAFPDAAAYAAARPEDLWPHVRSLGLFRNKARAIVAAARVIQERHAGRVPRTREALEALPGVGRKTAGVVLVHLGAGHAFPVDTHVGRLARRLGFSAEKDPDRVEQDLSALLPPAAMGRGPPAARLAREADLPRPEARLRRLPGGAALPEGGTA